jgi:hypothetical protein
MTKQIRLGGRVLLASAIFALALMFVVVFWIARIDVSKTKDGYGYDKTTH